MAVKNKKDRSKPRERDAGRIVAAELPFRELPGLASLRQNHFQIAINQSVVDDIHSHGDSASEVEVCGVLLGSVYRDSRGPWCFVEASVRGNFASGKETQVTITSETWTHVNEVRDRQHPDKRFIGWYHTHPGFGIFLSGMDDFIHANWFSEPWQIALVYDPQSHEEGVFVWRDGKTANEPFLIVPENGGTALRAGGSEGDASPASLPSGTLGDLIGRLQMVEQRQRMILAALGVLGLIAIVWPLIVLMFISGGSDKSRQLPAARDERSHVPSTLPTAVRPAAMQ